MEFIDSINLLKAERKLLIRVLEDLSEEQMLKVPNGLKNNIAWNLGHIVVTQQVLHYTLSRLELSIPKELVSMYRTGTNPETWKEKPNIEELKSLLVSLPDKLKEDFNNGLFTQFRSYKTSVGVELNSLGDAFAFNHFHEGTHTGIILSLKKLV